MRHPRGVRLNAVSPSAGEAAATRVAAWFVGAFVLWYQSTETKPGAAPGTRAAAPVADHAGPLPLGEGAPRHHRDRPPRARGPARALPRRQFCPSGNNLRAGSRARPPARARDLVGALYPPETVALSTQDLLLWMNGRIANGAAARRTGRPAGNANTRCCIRVYWYQYPNKPVHHNILVERYRYTSYDDRYG